MRLEYRRDIVQFDMTSTGVVLLLRIVVLVVHQNRHVPLIARCPSSRAPGFPFLDNDIGVPFRMDLAPFHEDWIRVTEM